MLPNDVWDHFLEVSVRAVTLGRRGDLAGGHAALRQGLREAKADQAAGQAWAVELISLYRRALDLYEESHGARLLRQAPNAAPDDDAP